MVLASFGLFIGLIALAIIGMVAVFVLMIYYMIFEFKSGEIW